ncbi:ATP-binding protein, partial [candidate division CSSED10-310 bacterium]
PQTLSFGRSARLVIRFFTAGGFCQKSPFPQRPLISRGIRRRSSPGVPPVSFHLSEPDRPEMDGYQVCQHLKAAEKTRDIPIIFISALDETEDKVKAFTVGGVDYITKPFHFAEVLARVQTHLALRNLQIELQKQIEELDAFAHTVAHDLKSPLTIIVGFADILEKSHEQLPPDQLREYLGKISHGGLKMKNIIEELLLLAEVRGGEIETQPLEMAEIIAETLSRLEYMIESTQARITVPPENAWPPASGYRPWVEEVWVNYLSNALKYGGEPPQLEFGASLAGNMVRFWIRDAGPGISAEDQAALFTPFTKLHHVHAKGHGLGLSIVQRIVTKLGGSAGVESQAGQGSTFYFTLPAVL